MIKDVQPLRDLSYLIDLKFLEWFNLKTFHLTNLVLLTTTSYILFGLLCLLGFRLQEAIIGTLLFAFHPILVSGFGWISSRKHVLGFLFILISVKSLLETKKMNPKIVISYILALCSHQIFVFYPLWVMIWMKIKKLKVSWPLFLSMMAGGFIIFFLGYYKTFYLGTGDDSYHLYSLSEHLSRSVLSAGRGASLIFTPIVIAAVYYQGSLYNLWGIALFTLYLFFLYKSPHRSDALPWVLLAAFTFTPTFIAFVNDTYLFLPLASVLIATLFLLRPITKMKKIALGVIIILLGLKTIEASKMWQSDLRLWQYSFEQENAPYNALQLANELDKKNPELALDFFLIGGRDFDLISHHPLMTKFVKAIYKSSLPLEKKITIFEECYTEHDIYRGFYGLTLLEGNQEQQAKGVTFLKRIAESDFKNRPGTLGFEIVEKVRAVCRNHQRHEKICQELKLSW